MTNQQAPVPPKPTVATMQTPQVVQLVVGKPEKSDDGMGGLEFASSVIGALAWPVAAVIIAAIFHKHIAVLLSKVRKLNWGDASVELAEKLDKVEDKSREVPGAPVVEAPLPDLRFQQLVTISPAAAILDSWGTVERMLYQFGTDHNLDPKTLTNPTMIMEKLARSGVIDSTVYSMLRDLRDIRNSAAHQREVTVTDALRFSDLSEKVIRALDKIEP